MRKYYICVFVTRDTFFLFRFWPIFLLAIMNIKNTKNKKPSIITSISYNRKIVSSQLESIPCHNYKQKLESQPHPHNEIIRVCEARMSHIKQKDKCRSNNGTKKMCNFINVLKYHNTCKILFDCMNFIFVAVHCFCLLSVISYNSRSNVLQRIQYFSENAK